MKEKLETITEDDFTLNITKKHYQIACSIPAAAFICLITRPFSEQNLESFVSFLAMNFYKRESPFSRDFILVCNEGHD